MRLRANGLDIEYETFGKESDPPVVLIIGFSQQLTAWDTRLCGQLTDRGFRVIRFDNRDAGLSSKIEGGRLPDIRAIISGDKSSVVYGLEDMALDTSELIGAVLSGTPFDSAHIVGTSMGGMIGQTLALRHPNRVKSLLSIMSTTGNPKIGKATPEALAIVMTAPPTQRDEYIEYGVRCWHLLRSPAFQYDESIGRAAVARDYDRSFCVPGAARQAAAILSQRDRTEALGSLRIPVTVIHGDADPLINMTGGQATAAAIPGAKLKIVPGLGHDLPAGFWPTIVDAVADNAKRAG